MGTGVTGEPDYDAAHDGAAAGIRRDRRFIEVAGKAPGEMLNGILTNSMPQERVGAEEAVARGSSVYSALLTAKGKMVSDMRVFRGVGDGFLLDLPETGFEGVLSHFGKVLPPRLARAEDRTEAWVSLSVLGPDGPSLLGRALGDLSLAPLEEVGDLEAILRSLGEEKNNADVLLRGTGVGTEAGNAARAVIVTGNEEFRGPGLDVLLSGVDGMAVLDRLFASSACPLSEKTMEVHRVEWGRPAFGKDMDESTIPVEAGIQARAIDDRKGCYPGQEVIVRIRDRGQVNKHLRGILLGDLAIPEMGRELFVPDVGRSVGWITTAVSSPAFGETVALGYVRRSVDPGETVRVGRPDGPEGRIRALGDGGWILT